MTRKLLLLAVIPAYTLLLACLTVPFIQAGTPSKKCPVPGHQGPVCEMTSCAGVKDGQPTGKKCSQFCAKGCCSCADGSCPREHNPEQQPEEQWLRMGFGD